MTDVPRPRTGGERVAGAVVTSPLALWTAFLIVQVWLALLCLTVPGQPMGDVTSFYTVWSGQALSGGPVVGIDTAWVYPVLAIVPMILAASFGPYAVAWLALVALLNAAAFGWLVGWARGPRADPARAMAGWWWTAFLLLLGPIALGRIDAVTVALGVVGATLVSSRPVAASVVLAIATWIKVWPAALIAAAVVALPARARVAAAAVGVSVAVIAVALALGSGATVFGFVLEQAGRGLQVEAPVSTVWMWLAVAGVAGSAVFYDEQILSFGVSGTGTAAVSAAMTPLLAIVVAGIVLLGARAARAGASPGALLPPLALALTAALIAVNKVGSPQFIGWLAVPVLLGLIGSRTGGGPSFRFPAAVGLAIAVLTQAIYPFLYLDLLSLQPGMVVVLSLRNALEFVLLGWAIRAVVRTGAPGSAIPGSP